jgi:hypothetical protein
VAEREEKSDIRSETKQRVEVTPKWYDIGIAYHALCSDILGFHFDYFSYLWFYYYAFGSRFLEISRKDIFRNVRRNTIILI